MAHFERDARKPEESPVNPQHNDSVTSGSTSDAEASAAHIADLVRRTNERQASPRPTQVLRPEPMSSPPSRPAPFVADAVPDAVPPVVPEVVPPVFSGVASNDISPALTPRRRPSARTLVVVGAVAALLSAGGVALSHSVGSAGSHTVPTAVTAKPSNPAPAGYAVKVTDVVTNCAKHSRGQTRTAFESENCVKATRSLAIGEVSGRPTLFVVSRIQMASKDAAASVKKVLDGTGTGNLNDLLREGRSFSGAPHTMPSSGYASIRTGPVVVVSEAGYIDGGASSNSIPALRAAALQVASLGTSAS